MGRRHYPQLHGIQWNKFEGEALECDCCAKPAKHFVRVQWSYMRGEDEVYGACDRHASMANWGGNFERYIAHLRTKDKFLKFLKKAKGR